MNSIRSLENLVWETSLSGVKWHPNAVVPEAAGEAHGGDADDPVWWEQWVRDHNHFMLPQETERNKRKQKSAAIPRTPEKLTLKPPPVPLRRAAAARVVHESPVRRHLAIGRKPTDHSRSQSHHKLGVGVWSPMKERLQLNQLCLQCTGTGEGGEGNGIPKTLFFLRGMVCPGSSY